MTDPADSAVDFQQTGSQGRKFYIIDPELRKQYLRNQIEHMKEDHISAQAGNMKEGGKDGIINGIQYGIKSGGFCSTQSRWFFLFMQHRKGMHGYFIGKSISIDCVP